MTDLSASHGAFDRVLLTYLRRSPLSYGKSKLAKRIDTSYLASEQIHITSEGLTYHLDLADYVMRQLYLFDTYESNTLRHFVSLLRPHMTFFDVGANIGAYSLPVAQRLPVGRVIAFEPNPPAISRLRRNIEASGMTNIEVVEKGLSDSKRVASMSETAPDGASGRNLSAAMVSEHVNLGGATVQLTTIDDYCSERNVTQIHAMKIDVEGHEMNVLDGAEATLESSEQMILVIEVNEQAERAGHTRSDLFDRLVDLDFRAYLPTAWPRRMKEIWAVDEGYSDNLIFLRGYHPSIPRGKVQNA